MNDNMKKRLKNYGLWTATFSLIGLVGSLLHIIKVPENYNAIVNLILIILIQLGIINNPSTENKGFSDDKMEVK